MTLEGQTIFSIDSFELIKVLLPVVVTAIFTYIFTRYNLHGTAKQSLREAQMKRVFGPIHLFYRFKDFDKTYCGRQIQMIIKSNTDIIPTSFFKAWEENQNSLEKFLEENRVCFEYTQKKLGYGKEKMTFNDKQKARGYLMPAYERIIKIAMVLCMLAIVAFEWAVLNSFEAPEIIKKISMLVIVAFCVAAAISILRL